VAVVRLDADILALHPDVVTIMYGTNDAMIPPGATQPRLALADYTSYLHELVQRIRAAGAFPVLMTPLPMTLRYVRWEPFKSQGPNFMLVTYVQAMREVAGQEQVPLVDNYATWLEVQAQGTNLDALSADGMHPNLAGETLLAGTIYPVLAEIMGASEVAPAGVSLFELHRRRIP